MVFGMAVFLGIGVPKVIGGDVVSIPWAPWIAATVNSLLVNGMAVGGIPAILMDRLLPATNKERGVEEEEAEIPAKTEKTEDTGTSDA